MPFCPYCGKEVTSSFSFCPSCGKQLNLQSAPKSTNQVPGSCTGNIPDNDGVQLKIKRMPSIVAVAMPYRIIIDGQERCKLMVGKETTISVPSRNFTIDVVMVGNSLSFCDMRASALISPDASNSKQITCTIRSEKTYKGIFFLAFSATMGKIEIDVEYN